MSLLSFREERRDEMVLRSRPRSQERFPLNGMAIRDRKKKKGNYFHGESEIEPIVTITIELSRIRIELDDRSLEKKNYAFFVKDGELLYVFVYDFVTSI